MREIRFRGKTIEGTWLYGNLIDGNRIVGKVVEWNGEYFDTEFWYKVDPETVGQYTGLKDVNGIEIYEGDVFKDNTDFNFWEVFYVCGGNYVSNGFETLPIGDFIIKSNICFCEIIGNIYDNPPELLKG
jgi:uncharacterized phage protein (TIGR01671 family)